MPLNTTGILVVEDEMIIAKGIEKRFKGMGYAVAGLVTSGEEAIEKAVELRPDLVLMDIRLGSGMDGIEAADRIRSRAHVPVVYLTAHSDDATFHRAKLSEPFGYILKPFEDNDLRMAIEIGLYRNKVERRIRENEQWLAATLAGIGDGVIATDAQGRVRFLNALAERLTGWTQAEALHRDVREVFRILGERTRQSVPNPALEALEKGEPVTLVSDTILIDKGGTERPIDDSAAPIRDVGGTVSGAVLVFRDITERRRLEEHLRQSQKMDAIGRLAGGIAHDFNNIMTVITGFSELVLAETSPTDPRYDSLRHIRQASMRAADLTQQILAFSRKQMLVPCVLNLNSVVRDMGAMIKRLIGSNIEFVTELDKELGQVRVDPTQIAQVLLNLAVNARDAMSSGGRLVVATANAVLGPPTTLRHPDVRPGRYVLLSVADTGCGMTDEVLAHLFEPFFSTKGVGQGTGLGLATVYGIVKQSEGHIEATSAVNEGTAFRVYLPIVEEPISLPSGREIRAAAKGSETILIVEDEEMVRRLTTTILRQNGYTVLEAPNGQEGVDLAKAHAGAIDLLITDLVMPKLSGRETAERLSALRPGLRVLYMSGHSEDVIVQQGILSGSDSILPKPFGPAALTNKVREVLDRP